MSKYIIITSLLLGFSLTPAYAFPWKKVLLFPVKVVVYPIKKVGEVVSDISYQVGTGLFLQRTL